MSVPRTQGVKLVNVMFGLQIEFITLKGLMGNEYKVSRCQLVTTATELFLHSGSIEGALKMLRGEGKFSVLVHNAHNVFF